MKENETLDKKRTRDGGKAATKDQLSLFSETIVVRDLLEALCHVPLIAVLVLNPAVPIAMGLI